MIVYTLDLETDPFLKGRKPEPFAAGLWNGERFWSTWGDDCVAQMMGILYAQPAGIVYLHNGGKFDIFYMLSWIDTEKDMLIIKDRITQCYMKCVDGYHRVRDSFKILPFQLKQYKKHDIEYSKLERDVRESNRIEILDYLKSDCVYLHELCTEYIKEFGPALTIGSTAMKELKKHHDIGEMLTQDQDAPLRKNYFLGGRVERYKIGVFPGNWKVYDVNSMYPFVMSSFDHPIGAPRSVTKEVREDTFFVTAKGFNRGAFPMRTKMGPHYTAKYGIFCVSIHEWNMAHKLDLFSCDEIIECVNFKSYTKFDNYITHYYNARKKAKHDGDKIKYMFYKFLLNNSYGKFAVNPDNFKQYRITDNKTDLRWYDFQVSHVIGEFGLILWEKPADEFKYANVATGASITGAARSVLMNGLHNSVNPIYCDTDSIICEELNNVVLDDTVLGGWKLENTGNSIAIAGRKMYALWDGAKCVKSASKGVRITPKQITRAANGEVIRYERKAPTFLLNGSVDWITRQIRMV